MEEFFLNYETCLEVLLKGLRYPIKTATFCPLTLFPIRLCCESRGLSPYSSFLLAFVFCELILLSWALWSHRETDCSHNSSCHERRTYSCKESSPPSPSESWWQIWAVCHRVLRRAAEKTLKKKPSFSSSSALTGCHLTPLRHQF